LTTAIEDTIKALMDYESELDKVKADAAEARKKVLRDATEWAETAKTNAIAKAQEMAASRVSEARSEAEKEAESIRKKGQSSLKAFEASLSKHEARASKLVAAKLLGEKQ
jgi:vacuolar-type H+-ATPase subunit H